MGICWYCFWGWPKQVMDIHGKYAKLIDELETAWSIGEDVLEYGPGHIVWSDENFEDGSINWCLEQIRTNRVFYDRYSDPEIELVKQSLEELLKVPEEIRCCEPEGYWEDDNNPEKYPPPKGIEMVKK